MEPLILFGEPPGYGDGDGDGYGYGYGDGYGDGSGDGSGYGDGDKAYWRACLPFFAEALPADQRARFDALRDGGVTIAYWLSDTSGAPANGGSGIVAKAGAIHETKGPLNLCARGTLHATHLPTQWKGCRWWIVALHGDVVEDDDKLGCLRREIIGECRFGEAA